MKKPLILDAQSATGTHPAAPKIEFPCENYPIKVIGHNSEDFVATVLQILAQFDTHFDERKLSHQDSRNGKFRSVRLSITAQSEQHLSDLNTALKNSSQVVTVI